MRLKSIETTPNPNSMKLNMDEVVGKTATYSKADACTCPGFIESLLNIDGVQSVFACNDFLTMNRDPRMDWQPILAEATRLLSGADSLNEPNVDEQRSLGEALGQVAVFVQTFRGIPIQVKVADAQGEQRVALDTRYSEAALVVQEKSGADYLKERYWADWGVRYGTKDEVAAEVVEEISGGIDENGIASLIERALANAVERATRSLSEIKTDLASDSWNKRLLAVQELGSSEEVVPLLIEALHDAQPQVRRVCAAALGATGSLSAVAPLTEALLNDSSVGVRRTAGDALSDIGDLSAQPAICKSLSDPNKLVRWRAARFLFDVGTEEALPFLKLACDDPEFEVRFEVQAAIERISGGKEGSMPAWKMILKSTESP